MITFENVKIGFAGKTLLRDVSFTVSVGDKVAFAGPSGSGKTSLLMALAGVCPVHSGRIILDGLELNPATVFAIRQKVAYIGQEPVLGADLVEEALLLPLSFQANQMMKNAFSREEMLKAMDHLGLDEGILSKKCSKVSGGEKQRLAIVRAVLLGKKIFLADEVTSALDEQSREAVISLLNDPHITVLSVAHDKLWLDNCRIFDIKEKVLIERKV